MYSAFYILREKLVTMKLELIFRNISLRIIADILVDIAACICLTILKILRIHVDVCLLTVIANTCTCTLHVGCHPSGRESNQYESYL